MMNPTARQLTTIAILVIVLLYWSVMLVVTTGNLHYGGTYAPFTPATAPGSEPVIYSEEP